MTERNDYLHTLLSEARRVSADMRVRAIIPGNPAEQAADVIDALVAIVETTADKHTGEGDAQ